MKRYELIDTLRGLSVISMILFHTCWIMNYFGLVISTETMFGPFFSFWERTICFGFILISGYSFSLGRRHLRSGLIISLCGILITLVTCIFLPQIRIVFGILTFLGAAGLIMIPVDKAICGIILRSRANTVAGSVLSLFLFAVTYNINRMILGIQPFVITLPAGLYKGYPAAFIGFTEPGFFSTDYFSLLPWFFLYVCGYMIHKAVKGTDTEKIVADTGIPCLSVIGRHSLPIYIIHPVVIFAVVAFLKAKVL